MITTVIFDVGEVLFRGILDFDRRLSAVLKQEVGHEQLWESPEMQMFLRGRLLEVEMWQALIERFGWKTNVKFLKLLARGNFLPVPGTLEVAKDLRRRGFKLAILSVHGREWVTYLEGQRCYHKHFDHAVYSYQTGHMKPEPEAYQDIMNKLGRTKPQSCLFIDDFEANIFAARQLGFLTHHFTNAANLRRDIEQLGLFDRPQQHRK